MAKASPKTKRPSMSDVARLAGVSRTTVSFVLNDVPHANIPEETRKRIQDAVEQLGYRPNAMARGLRSSQSHTIGFLSDEIVTSPHTGQLIQGAQDTAWNNQKLLLLFNTGGNRDMERQAIDLMLERQVEGIIYATMYHHMVSLPEQIREVPVVLTDCYVQDRSLASVVPDEVNGGRVATEAMLQRGHRRIGFISNEDPIPATFGRLEGYKQAVENYGVSFDEELVVSAKSTAQGGRSCCKQLFQLSDPPTALFCFSDFMAMGAYQTLWEMELKVPNDVAIVGFDNHELIAPALVPALSTMALPHYEMGKWAVEHLLKLLETPEMNEADEPVQHTLECSFVERDSVMNPL
jgi:LacI family transcriptional regulator